MSDSLRQFLVKTGVGLGLGLVISLVMGFAGDGERMTWLRAFCDGYFLSASIFLAWGGLVFTYNGGAMDGLGFTFKTFAGLFKQDYEEQRVTFREYRENREKNAKSPRETLLAGAVLLAVAVLLLMIYDHL